MRWAIMIAECENNSVWLYAGNSGKSPARDIKLLLQMAFQLNVISASQTYQNPQWHFTALR